jgi:1,6-anhydro-N-acetylmuramate kinase
VELRQGVRVGREAPHRGLGRGVPRAFGQRLRAAAEAGQVCPRVAQAAAGDQQAPCEMCVRGGGVKNSCVRQKSSERAVCGLSLSLSLSTSPPLPHICIARSLSFCYLLLALCI